MTLISVILSGGTGARLWPVSRQACPKPFMKIGTSTLLQQALERGQACGTDNAIIVTNQDYLFMSRDVVAGLGDPSHAHYLLEPKGRNTASAIALAAMACADRHGPDAVMLILPADHLIPDSQAFVACVLEAAQHARQGQLVVFGISPTSPDTAFGYIKVEKISRSAQKALNFVEKPDMATAQLYLSTGLYYWNSGMFCFTAATILQAFKTWSPDVMNAAEHAWAERTTDKDATRFEPHSFGMQPDISIDYAVMERAGNVTMVPARFGWSDVGSWPAMAQAHPVDSSGNTFTHGTSNLVVALDTKDTHVHASGRPGRVVATVGIENLIIVDTPDALLIAHKSAAQKVKAVVDILKERKHDSAQQIGRASCRERVYLAV